MRLKKTFVVLWIIIVIYLVVLIYFVILIIKSSFLEIQNSFVWFVISLFSLKLVSYQCTTTITFWWYFNSRLVWWHNLVTRWLGHLQWPNLKLKWKKVNLVWPSQCFSSIRNLFNLVFDFKINYSDIIIIIFKILKCRYFRLFQVNPTNLWLGL